MYDPDISIIFPSSLNTTNFTRQLRATGRALFQHVTEVNSNLGNVVLSNLNSDQVKALRPYVVNNAGKAVHPSSGAPLFM